MTYLKCEDCQKTFEFDEPIEKNKANISKEECNDYSISLIKKLNNNDFEYTIIIICKNCNSKKNRTFTKKENNFHLECNNCNLKGLNIIYFLSLEEENKPEFENNEDINKMRIDKSTAPPIIPVEIMNELRPLNDSGAKTSEDSYSNKNNTSDDKYQERNEEKKNNYKREVHKINDINIPISEINRPPEMISNIEPSNRNIKSEKIKIPEKIFRTPNLINQNNNNNNNNNNFNNNNYNSNFNNKNILGEKITVTFVKNGNEYNFNFYEREKIIDKIEEINKIINIGPNCTYYYNSDHIDINKTFKENRIFNGAAIEIIDEVYY